MIQDEFSDIKQYAELKDLFSAPPMDQKNIDPQEFLHDNKIDQLLFCIFVTYSPIRSILLPKIKLLKLPGINESKSNLQIFQIFISFLLYNYFQGKNINLEDEAEINADYYKDLIQTLNPDLCLFADFPDIQDEEIDEFFLGEIKNRTLKRYVFITEKQLKPRYDITLPQGIVLTMQLSWAIYSDHAIARGQNGQYYELKQNSSQVDEINPPEPVSDTMICCYQLVNNN